MPDIITDIQLKTSNGTLDLVSANLHFNLRMHQAFTNAFMLHFKRKKLYSKPWITKGLIKFIKTKCILFKKSLKHPSPLQKPAFSPFENISKRNFYDTKCDNAKGSLKETWKILNKIMNKRKTTSKIPSLFTYNNQQINDPLEIANNFVNISQMLALALQRNYLPLQFHLTFILRTEYLNQYF